jgi:hypothetical protein
MSFFLPEGTASSPADSELRSIWKWNQILFETHGNVGSVAFPEGTQPLPSDNEMRGLQKIDAIKKAIE